MNRAFIPIAIIFILFVLLIAYSYNKTYEVKEKGNPVTRNIKKVDSLEVGSTAAKNHWKYNDYDDPMDNKLINIASLVSENTHKFPFPYDYSSFVLSVRRKSGKIDIYLQCTSCQFLYDYNATKKYRIRFDDEAPFKVSLNRSSSGGSDIVFLGSTQSIYKKILKAKVMMIEPEFYNAGFVPLKFNVEGLKL